MKKILIFSTAYYPHLSGAELAVDEIAKRITDYQFDLIAARMDKKLTRFEKYHNVNIYRVGFGCKILDKFLLPFCGFFKALELNRKNNYDIIWSLMASQASIAAAFLKIRLKNKKLVLTLQEGDEEEYLTRYVFGNKFLYKILIRPWHLLVFKKADNIVAISQYLKKRAEDNGVKCPIEIIPNGVDTDIFSKEMSGVERQERRVNLNFKEDDIILVHTGRLNYKNSLENIIKALPLLEARVKFLSIGQGEELEKLKKIAQELKVSDRVIFHDFVPQAELVNFLKMSDIFIRPSLSEGLGSSFLEAMAAGVLVIATPVGGIPDFLIHGQTGLFCEVNNPGSIAEQVNYYINNRGSLVQEKAGETAGVTYDYDNQVIDKIISIAKKLIEEKYTWPVVTDKMKKIFEKLTQ